MLETFIGRGLLAVARRHGFERQYDLAERVVPNEHRDRRVERDEAERELLRAWRSPTPSRDRLAARVDLKADPLAVAPAAGHRVRHPRRLARP